jgi:hypothetical protein
MKDKLEKTGHTKSYYRIKNVLLTFVFALAVGAAAAIPVGISYHISTEEIAAAKAAEDSASSSASSQSENLAISSAFSI